MDVKLQRITQDIKTACFAQMQRLFELYPIGSIVEFRITDKQHNTSTGVVKRCEPSNYGGIVIVEHLEAKERSRYKIRRVPVSMIKDSHDNR